MIKKKLPKKLKDLKSFTISSKTWEHLFDKALYNLGVSINLMPLYIIENLRLATLTPTTFSIQMVDRSLKYPKGLIEDVLVKVNKFIFPVDFVLLDMEEDIEVPIILGRPFFIIRHALIDVP